MTVAAPIPVTVVGGFLGSGKTTLLNHILATAQKRYAVLVNDFGALNVDMALIKSGDGLKKQLDNGCICCSISEGIAPALEELLAVEPAPEAIIIEASGVGDPLRIAEFAIIDDRLVPDIVLTLADAGHIEKHLRDERIADTLERQLARADLIVLNKADTVSADHLTRLKGLIETLTPSARIVTATQGRVAQDILSTSIALPMHPAAGTGRRDHDHTDHEDMFSRWFRPAPIRLHRTSLEEMLARLPRSLLRLKGWIRFTDSEGLHLLQYVAGRWELTPDADYDGPLGIVGIGLHDPRLATALDAMVQAGSNELSENSQPRLNWT